jgi:mannose-1-phosphate guanylyltransferase
MDTDTNLPAETDQMDPIRGIVREARRRVIAEDIARANELRPQIAAEEAALANAEAVGAVEIERKRQAFVQAQAAAHAAQAAYIAAQRVNDARCVPARARLAALGAQLHRPSAGFGASDPGGQFKLVPGTDLGPAGAAGLRPDRYWDPSETHPHGPLNPRREGGRD